MKDRRRHFSFLKLRCACCWEAKKRFYACRYPLAVFVGLLLLVWILPQPICQWIDQRMRLFPAALSWAFAVFIMLYLMAAPAVWMAEPYGKPVYNRERMGDICTKTRILARLLITLSWTAVLTGGGILATEAMKKFAGVNHAYFQLAMEGSFIQMIVVFGAVLPMLYLVIFLWVYRRSGMRRNISSYLLALLLTNLLSENLNRNLRFWEGSWQMDLVWLAAAAILSFICLYLAAYLEETTE